MLQTVSVPLWLLVLILLFAGASFLSHFLFPSVRWFFRRRMERAVEELNKRLDRPIHPFRMVRRQDQVVRLVHDAQVMDAVGDYARTEQVPHNVAFERAKSYAREIVPGFSTATYFGFAIRVARRLSRGLYKVRVGQSGTNPLAAIDPRSAVVFVMNHRSNMDYVLITWLAADRSALSYAVGEWARIWPLKALIRAMGAYFIRRRYSNPLYRAVLARYVQMSIREGVTQAMFPEGGLSLDGRIGPPKLGLLTYIARDFQPQDGRDVVFVPVALNYDRVLEDRVLIRASQTGERRFRVRLPVVLGFALRVLAQKLTGRFRHFGHAAVCYGQPLSLREFMQSHPDPSIARLADLLMDHVRTAVPILPVPLAAAVLASAGRPISQAEGLTIAEGMVDRLRALGAQMYLPGDARAFVEGLEALRLRRIVGVRDGQLTIPPDQVAAVAFYAASVLERLTGPSTPQSGGLVEPPAGTGT